MKRSLRIAAGVGLLGIVFLLSACPWDRKHGIVILPTQKTHLRLEQNWSSVEGVLAKYNREIFLIRSYKDGKPMPNGTVGKMDELLLERPVQQFDSLAADTGFTGHAVQIGVGISKVDTDIRFIGREPQHSKGHGNDEDKSDESPQPLSSAQSANSSGKSSSHAHAVGVYGRTSSHAHLIQLVDESAELIKEIDPIIDGSGDPDDKP